jgi:hypothetical protein
MAQHHMPLIIAMWCCVAGLVEEGFKDAVAAQASSYLVGACS